MAEINQRTKTLAVDFDGVIHRNKDTWRGRASIKDIPVAGAVEALASLREEYTIIVHTCRARSEAGTQAVRQWLDKHGIEVDDVTALKPGADVYLDDKAVRFNGNWVDSLSEVKTKSQTMCPKKDAKLYTVGNIAKVRKLKSIGKYHEKHPRKCTDRYKQSKINCTSRDTNV